MAIVRKAVDAAKEAVALKGRERASPFKAKLNLQSQPGPDVAVADLAEDDKRRLDERSTLTI